jgi:hypothetical protein
MYGIKTDFLLSVLRHILTAAGTFVVAKGWISADMSGQLVGAIITIASVAFALTFHGTSNGAIDTVSTTSNAIPNVQTRTTVTAATPETLTAAAQPATAVTTVTTTKPEEIK